MARVHPVSPPVPIPESPIPMQDYPTSDQSTSDSPQHQHQHQRQQQRQQQQQQQPLLGFVFPHHRYQLLGATQMTLGVLSMASGSYDLTLYLHPEWFHRDCYKMACGNHSVVYGWLPWAHMGSLHSHHAWLVPCWPALVGFMVCALILSDACTCKLLCALGVR